MGWFSILFEWIIGWFVGKKNLVSKIEVRTIRKKIIATRRLYSTKAVVQVNFDLKPKILKLFFLSYWINFILFALSIFVNVCYNFLFIFRLFAIQIDGIDSSSINIPWIGGIITVLITCFFLIRFIRDIYKVSLRGKYRANYLKLLWLDFVTLNLFLVIGTIIFWKSQKQSNASNDDEQKNIEINFNTESIKLFTKIITKVEVSIFFFFLITFGLAFLIGYLAPTKSVKIICLCIISWTMVFIQAWSITKLVGLIILKKLLNQLISTNDYYLLLTVLRFLGLNFYGYYLSVFINVLGFDENYKDFIIQQW